MQNPPAFYRADCARHKSAVRTIKDRRSATPFWKSKVDDQPSFWPAPTDSAIERYLPLILIEAVLKLDPPASIPKVKLLFSAVIFSRRGSGTSLSRPNPKTVIDPPPEFICNTNL